MKMQFNEVDVRVLDLIADDYYGLWEVRDYFVQLMSKSNSLDATKTSKSRVKTYFREGLIDVFVGTMTKNDFRKVNKENVLKILARESSWRPPQGSAEVFAVRSNEKAEKALVEHPIDWG